MVSFLNIPLDALGVVLIAFFLIFRWYYNRMIKRTPIRAIYVNKNASGDSYGDAEELIDQNKIKIVKKRKSLFSRAKAVIEEKIIDGLPLEMRLSASRRERWYLVGEGQGRTLNWTEDLKSNILAKDAKSQAIHEGIGKFRGFQESLAQGQITFSQQLMPLLLGITGGMLIMFFLRIVFPAL